MTVPVLQVSAFLKIIPPWLPTVAVASGFVLVAVGMGQRYFEGVFGHRSDIPDVFGVVTTLSFALSIGGATYVSIHRDDLALLFVFFTFMSGRLIQGAIAARLLQKLLDFFLSSSASSEGGYLDRACRYVKEKLKERALILAVTGIISVHTILSIAAVYVIGSDDPLEAIERFWVGFFFLVVAGLVFDFRYFAHRISWTAAIGLVIAVAGAFLYSPAVFSASTGALAPYLDNPIPDWARWPLGAIGFVFGVLLWAVFYVKEG